MEVPSAGPHSDGMPSLAATLLTITVRVYDIYGLTPAQRHEALVVAADTLAEAGVEVNWVECRSPLPPACSALLAPGEMVLRFDDREHRSGHVLGTAIIQRGGPNVMATVFTPSVWDRSFKHGVRLSTVVGRVAAHEIGHLLLGTNSHSPIGLMRAGWDIRRVEPTDWRFSSRDAAAIKRKLLEAGAATRSASAETARASAAPRTGD
jgi:hypothetical protein